MKIYSFKSIARRGSLLGAAFALAASTLTPFAPAAFADALNPLTDRSLTLSSSSPGWANTDGSGNSTYAPPNSGANGQKTGNYFDFKVSSSATVNTFSFQYCTNPAGDCNIPGDDATEGVDTATTSDLNTEFPETTPTDLEVDNADFATVIDASTGAVKAVPGYENNNPKYSGTGDPAEAAKDVTGNYIVMTESGGTWTQSSGWNIAAHTVTTGTRDATKNYITLSNATGAALTAGQQVKVLFFATDTYYITNPGSGAFFVKINSYNKEYTDSGSPTGTQVGLTGLEPDTDANVIDGGVTVANVMNQSIQITTKVLETMQFSVGTVDPNTLTKAELAASDNGNNTHTPCDTILTRMTPSDPQNVLQLGDQTSESSLKTDQTYATHSYWRLSSNSSAGATVYYSGHTLANTVGDEIDASGVTARSSAPGSEQFGLALSTVALAGGNGFDDATYGVNYATAGVNENGADDAGGVAPTLDDSVLTDLGATNGGSWDYTNLNQSYHVPRLDPLVPETNYAGGSGTLVSGGTAQFAFDSMSDTVPVPIASQDTEVVDCVTAKMRYIANIAATTPAGIYTTKINYIAAPQY